MNTTINNSKTGWSEVLSQEIGADFQGTLHYPVTQARKTFYDEEYKLERSIRDLPSAILNYEAMRKSGRKVKVLLYEADHVSTVYLFATRPDNIVLKKSTRTEIENAKVGDLFKTSWGYDQTNYNFLMVVGFTASGKSAICRMVRATLNEEESGRSHDALEPTQEAFGDEFRMKVDGDYLRGSYPFLRDGIVAEGRRMGSFSRVKEGSTYAQTATGWGH